jgi:hypothetical protein
MRKSIAMILSVVLAAFSAQAEIVYTGQGTTTTYHKLSSSSSSINAATQLFTVPAGQVCTKVEMWAEKHGSYYQYPGYTTHIAVYAVGSYSTPIAIKSYAWNDPYWVDVTGAYLVPSTSDLSLSAGTYEVEIWCNTAMACTRCFAKLYTDSTYSGGYAENGWVGSNSMGDTYDFDVRLTLKPETWNPEAALMGWYDDRWGDACNTTASAIASENASVVLPYLSGVNFASYQSHVNASANVGLKLIFEFNRYDVNNSNTSSITSLVQSFSSHPGVYGWYTADEPYGNGTALAPLVTAYNTIKAISGKPVMIAFNSGDVSHQTPITYANAYDILMADYYPFSSGSLQYSGLSGWKTFITSVASQAATAGKEWWSIIQAYGTTSGYACNFTMRLPTYTETNFMTFWSVLQGAKGVMLWSRTPCLYSIAQASAPYAGDGVTWAENVGKPVMDVFKACAAAIYDGEVSGGVTDNNTNVVSALYKDTATNEYFLIAANSTMGIQSNVQFTLMLPTDYINAIPLGENREAITLSDSSFTDNFGDYGVHVYRLMPNEQVINTYSGSNTTYWKLIDNGEGCAVQWFTVPKATKGTKFEFLAEIGQAYSAGYHCNVQIYSADGTYIATGSKTADQFEYSSDWVAVENLSLKPGKYFAQMFTKDTGFKGYLHAIRVYPSTYAGGYAAGGWSGGTALGDGMDFKARLTVVQDTTVVLTPGDANGDDLVDVGDLGILAANYGRNLQSENITPSQWWGLGDFNNDGVVDVGDLGILAANYGTNSSSANFEADYAKVFGTSVAEEESEETISNPICSGLGLSIIAGLALIGMMLIRLEE